MEIKNTKSLKKYNKKAVLTEIINRQPISRAKLSDYLDVSHTTISNLIHELKKEGLIIEKRSQSTGGRPPKLLSFNGDDKYNIAIIFKERVILIGLFNLNNELLERKIIKVTRNSFDIISNKLEKAIDQIFNKKNIQKNNIYGIGGSLPSCYQDSNDKLINSNLAYLPNHNLKRELKEVFDYANIYIENYANIEAFYEWNNKLLRKYNNLLYIVAEDKIGSGLIIDNELYKGSFNKAGSIEHIIVDPNGKKCACGKNGCLVTTSSIKAIEDDFNEALWKGSDTNIEELFESPYDFKKIIKAYLKDEPLSKKIIDNFLKYFSIALANIIKIIDPQAVVLCGLFDEFDETMIDTVHQKVKNSMQDYENSFPTIMKRTIEKNYQLKAINSYIFHQLKTKI